VLKVYFRQKKAFALAKLFIIVYIGDFFRRGGGLVNDSF
jgi:hypothetical protein